MLLECQRPGQYRNTARFSHDGSKRAEGLRPVLLGWDSTTFVSLMSQRKGCAAVRNEDEGRV